MLIGSTHIKYAAGEALFLIGFYLQHVFEKCVLLVLYGDEKWNWKTTKYSRYLNIEMHTNS